MNPLPTMSVSGGDQSIPTINPSSTSWVSSLQADRTTTGGECVYVVPDLTTMVQNSSTDNCTSNSTDFTITQYPLAGTTITANTSVSVTATDLCDNISEAATVTITVPAAIMVSTPTQSWTYDGNSHDSTTFNLTSGDLSVIGQESGSTVTLPNGDIATVTVAGSVQNVSDGLVPNVATVTVTDASNNDVTCYYTVSVDTGKLSINPAVVTVTADDKTKFVGDTDPELTATVTGVVDGYNIMYSITRETGDTVGIYTITPSGETTQGNYSVNYVTGTLTILPDSAFAVVACYSDIQNPTLPQIPGSCTPAPVLSGPVIDPPASQWNTCTKKITYTYAYTDCNGESQEWVFTYVVKDTIPPTLAVQHDTVDAVHALNAAGTDCVYSYPVIGGSVVNATAHCGSYVGSAIEYTYDVDTTQPISQEDTVKYVKVTVTATDVCNNSNDTIIYVKVPARLQLTATPTADDDTVKVTCFGGNNGEVTLNVTGGTSNYTYIHGIDTVESSALTHTFSNLSVPANHQEGTDGFGDILVGKDTLTVIDAHGCSTTAAVMVQSPDSLYWKNCPSDVVVCCDPGKNYATVSPGANFIEPMLTTEANIPIAQYARYVTNNLRANSQYSVDTF